MSNQLISFGKLDDSAYVRASQLVSVRTRPGIPVPLPFSAPTLWRKVREGTFPPPVKLGPRMTAWRVGDIRAWMLARTESVEVNHG